MSPCWSTSDAEDFIKAKAKAHRRPSLLLKRRERQIIARRFPEPAELSELAAIRNVLRSRGTRAPIAAPA